jgi:hypothetical protein
MSFDFPFVGLFGNFVITLIVITVVSYTFTQGSDTAVRVLKGVSIAISSHIYARAIIWRLLTPERQNHF